MRRTWTTDEIRALGAVTDLPTAGAILGIGRSTAYALAASGDFPVPVLRIGSRYRISVARLLALIDGDLDPARSDGWMDPMRGGRNG